MKEYIKGKLEHVLTERYRYTFDEKGNWLTKIIMVAEKPTYCIRREYIVGK